MGASSNFYLSLKEKEQYAIVTMRMPILNALIDTFEREQDFTVNQVLEMNKSYSTDEILQDMYKEKKKITNKIIKREQELIGNIKK